MERTKGTFRCSNFKVFIRLDLTRGLHLMTPLFLFSLTLFFASPQIPSTLSLLPSPHLYICPVFSLFLCAYLPSSYLFVSVSSLTALFVPLPHLASLFSLFLSLKVDYRTEDGTANAGSDYEFAEGTLLFKPGETFKGKKTQNKIRKFSHNQ